MSAYKTSGLKGRLILAMSVFLLWAASGSPAWADDCSDFPGGILDGALGMPAPSQINIDQNCIIRNYPASNPLSSNFSFYTSPGQNDQRWVVVFDNVVHTGQMACNAVAGHKIWFTNGSSTAIKDKCQNLLIPVEKIDKQNPPGLPIASIGVPFTYTLTMPVLFDPATGTVINSSGSNNDLHGVTLTDDLNATGVDLTYLSHVAYWQASGAPVAHTFSQAGGVLSFGGFPIVPAGDQIVIEITVVLEDTPANVPGTQFVNTAKWEFGRLIDGEFFQPLPGEWGISEPLTVAGPELTLTKSGPAALNLGVAGDFTLDVQNIGNSDAWNVTIDDRLPNTADGGMCGAAPIIQNARVFAADGVTPVPGKGPLNVTTDFVAQFNGAPACELTLTMLTAAAVIGPGERLIIEYQSVLDNDSDNGAAFTNVAGAVEWFNDSGANPNRQSYARTLTNGTVGVVDHQDAHTVGSALSGTYFEKTVQNLTSGDNPATIAAPGDRLRYTLRVRTTDSALNNFTISDDLGVMNPTRVFATGTLALVPGTVPPGANTSGTNPFAGTGGMGLLNVSNLSLPVDSELEIQFDVTLFQAIFDGTVISNQADLIKGVKLADSDDPTVNGAALPDVDGDEDPTRIVIQTPPPAALQKANTQASAGVGDPFSYRITVPSTPHTAPLYDIRILDDLNASAADLRFVDVRRISGSGSWNPVNTGTATNLVIEDPVNGIDIPAGEQAVIEITVVLRDTPTNVAGLTFTNTAAYTYTQIDGDPRELDGDPGTSAPMTIVEPQLTVEKSGPGLMRIGPPGTFTLNVHNTGASPAFDVTLIDALPDETDAGMCDAAPAQFTARLFAADGVTPVGPALVQGSDFAVSWNPPTCTFTLTTLSAAAGIGPDQRLIVTYQALLDTDSDADVTLTNVAGATGWRSGQSGDGRLFTAVVSDGTPGLLDHQDNHSLLTFEPLLSFEKTVVNVTTGEDPATVATPGDRLRYHLRVENVGVAPLNDFSIVDELDRLQQVPAYQAGTLTLISAPPGADTSGTSATGGADGTGIVDVAGLSLPNNGDSVEVEFEVTLAPVIANASYVQNQSQVVTQGFVVELSDDPNVGGPSDPMFFGDEDPTRVQIESAPLLDVDKTSTYLDGDPNVLMAGETLRYTITVRNIGTDHATNAMVRDQVPANTAYVAGSTTLNGAVVADVGGLSPLTNGMTINSPNAATAGFLSADQSVNNAAVVTFDVVADPNAIDGTVLSNQAFVTAVAGIIDQPSDDPRTAVPDDPTRDVVGNVPLIFAEKSAALQQDFGSIGVVDPGDWLRYTITIYNNGPVDATNVVLTDDVPVNTTYVEDTVTLNGEPVGRPDDGTFPIAVGIAVSSGDLTPPLPAPGAGTLTSGGVAVVQFDVRVDDGLATGTLITNQAVVSSDELPDQLTDGDGDPATGPEPTVVVVGPAQQLAITKQAAVVGGGPVIAGATLEYLVRVRTVGPVPAIDVNIIDDLDFPTPGYLTYVPGSATANGQSGLVTVDGATLTVAYGDLESDGVIDLRFQAVVNGALPMGTRVTNRAVAYWNTDQQVEASVSVDIGGVVGVGVLNGTVWHDASYDNQLDATERVLEGWTVELYRNDELVHTTMTAAEGTYQITGLTPNYLSGDALALVFTAPGAGPNTALLGEAYSADFTTGLQRISDIVIQPGNNLTNLDLPIDPNGVVYDSVSRSPVAGATLTLVNSATGAALPAGCFDDPAQQNQVTRADGYYKFDLNFSSSACAAGASHSIEVLVPPVGYTPGRSVLIPPTDEDSPTPFNVAVCGGSAQDAVPATVDHCEVTTSELAPPTSVQAQSVGTNYRVLQLVFDNSDVPGSAQIFNNHIPVDPILDGAVAITKTTPMVNVTRGQLVPYTITVTNTFPVPLQDIGVVDRFPPGFRYVEGSARIDGVAVEPVMGDREMTWSGLTLAPEGQHKMQMLLGVGAGVSEGEFVNRAQAVNTVAQVELSGEATATVRVVPDPTFDCTDVMGKVYDDSNRNGLQDGDEMGLQGVRLVTANGLVATTDQHGRFHITCAVVPRDDRGSNFVLKLDDRTLPSGFRASTDRVQIKRATRGKALHFSFGASIHRVVGLEVADGVFVPDTTEIRPQWRDRFDLLIEELHKAPSVLRLTYLADLEDPKLVDKRLRVIRKEVVSRWKAQDGAYRLELEHDVFWRLGEPAKQSVKRRSGDRDD